MTATKKKQKEFTVTPREAVLDLLNGLLRAARTKRVWLSEKGDLVGLLYDIAKEHPEPNVANWLKLELDNLTQKK